MSTGANEVRRRDGVDGVKGWEIEPGRGVPNNWDRHLSETWEERKARLAAERLAASWPSRAAR